MKALLPISIVLLSACSTNTKQPITDSDSTLTIVEVPVIEPYTPAEPSMQDTIDLLNRGYTTAKDMVWVMDNMNSEELMQAAIQIKDIGQYAKDCKNLSDTCRILSTKTVNYLTSNQKNIFCLLRSHYEKTVQKDLAHIHKLRVEVDPEKRMILFKSPLFTDEDFAWEEIGIKHSHIMSHLRFKEIRYRWYHDNRYDQVQELKVPSDSHIGKY